jgi:ribosome-associated translation inhibitor RaiA
LALDLILFRFSIDGTLISRWQQISADKENRMHYELTNRTDNFTNSDTIKAFLDGEVAKLDPIVEDFPDNTMLRIIVDEGGNSNVLEVQLRLSLPGNIFVSHEPGPDFRKAFDQAFKELKRQVLDYKTSRRDQQRQRGA